MTKTEYKYQVKVKPGAVIKLGDIPFRVLKAFTLYGNNKPYEIDPDLVEVRRIDQNLNNS